MGIDFEARAQRAVDTYVQSNWSLPDAVIASAQDPDEPKFHAGDPVNDSTPTDLMPAERELLEIWEKHVTAEFVARDAREAVRTMTEDVYVDNVPLLVGGMGKKAVEEFYSRYFLAGTLLCLYEACPGGAPAQDLHCRHLRNLPLLWIESRNVTNSRGHSATRNDIDIFFGHHHE